MTHLYGRQRIFLYFCTAVLLKVRAAVFYWKESEFSLIRLGEPRQFANICTDNEAKLAY